MSESTQLRHAVEMMHEGEHEEHGEHIHLPGPSIWPVVLAVGIFLIAMGLVAHLAFAGAGFVIVLVGVAGWIYETRAQALDVEGLENPHWVHSVLFQYMAEKEPDVARPGGLRGLIDQHLVALKSVPGCIDQQVLRTANHEGPVQVIVSSTWKDADALADYEESEASLEALVQESDVIVQTSLQVYDLQEAG
ncbi:MAG: hypothetical protein GEU28_11995 [Dehalococcoidia bacterium]|nr:hypothetical protein [Dehalococcoidia bacterium]